ncbi:ParB N-terminal domain-containing protein [Elizabethkingia occulta]|uniref:ParB N-terminal domain-containing protein n=1 Tax=Elizabethkingia occulta TaxID=1867263 RepID=UPI00099B1596|nr:ParB N-terminal domain-containing protein [Elizabethkingia occulta]OPB87859.1 hypothetical protein BB020_04570 [Elizabethkingia occulta]
MSETKYKWLYKKTPRSVEQLRLWPENPRLNPAEKHVHISDFVEDLIYEDSDKKEFFKLLKSIAEDGFIPADPIVIWKNEENGKSYVAEGNRRVIALKLLREPNKAPKSIRGYVRNLSSKMDLKEIERVYVNSAPTFEDAEWYINQRNSISSLQQRWSRIQQQRWITELYEKYSGDIDKITSITKMSLAELESFIRILKINDFVKDDFVKSNLSKEEYEKASSYKFPISILERFFSNKEVREKWGVNYEGIDVKLVNRNSFLKAYSQLIKDIVNKNSKNPINTRTITTDLESILNKLPSVDIENPDINIEESNSSSVSLPIVPEGVTENEANNELEPSEETKPLIIKNDPNRSRLVLSIYNVNSDSHRISGLFDELKKIPISYNNCIASSVRVFLDLCIFKYIETESLESNISEHFKKSIKDVSLKNRIEYLKQHKLPEKQKKIAEKLLESKNDFSLDVLNGYVHSQDTHYLNKNFLNRFWDFLFPLLQYLIEIKEEK